MWLEHEILALPQTFLPEDLHLCNAVIFTLVFLNLGYISGFPRYNVNLQCSFSKKSLLWLIFFFWRDMQLRFDSLPFLDLEEWTSQMAHAKEWTLNFCQHDYMNFVIIYGDGRRKEGLWFSNNGSRDCKQPANTTIKCVSLHLSNRHQYTPDSERQYF